MPSASGQFPIIIGRKELLDFPEWGVRQLRVKVDTGARTSAIDVARYDVGAGSQTLRLELVLDPRRPAKVTTIEAPLLGMTVVRNTGGGKERRPVVEALIRLGPVARRIRLTVTDRSAMRHRMILGRQALAGMFLVDVTRKYLLGPTHG